ncbi:hypothetical protein [Nitrospirillum sp. BR 11163]|uniref:hypothetical protein n=1 Tax=Nitrospirillum sp. BR 11163 TaxID=3104323 RepID=UPI002AFF59EA|nr:hypothetical protein [Nitrospirillum sp. BR 11163]MEA1674895.1 hypothetical protein [Nitrospirillum sp. BR 11163]
MNSSDDDGNQKRVWTRDEILMSMLGDMIVSRDFAQDYADLLIRHRHGEEQAARYRPWTAEDKGKTWEVTSGVAADEDEDGAPSIYRVTIAKQDGRILMYKQETRVPVVHGIAEIIRSAKKKEER